MFKHALIGILTMAITHNVHAALKTESLEYSTNDTIMEGFIAYDDSNPSPKPGILIVHDWMGLRDFTQQKAEQLAKKGYVALAVDVYGKGVRPQNTDEAAKLITLYKGNRPLLQSHIRAAYDKFVQLPMVDAKKIVVMGYCFGGTTALELARTGAPLVGTVTFHGGLDNPTPENAKNIKGKLLILHGAEDPLVNTAEVAAFKQEINNAHVPMEFIAYPGAVHAFTNPQAGNDKTKGLAYNAEADRLSWQAFEKFLKEVFK